MSNSLKVKRTVSALPVNKLVSFVSDVLKISLNVDNEFLKKDRQYLEKCFADYREVISGGGTHGLTEEIHKNIKMVDVNYVIVRGLVSLKELMGEQPELMAMYRGCVGKHLPINRCPIGERLGMYRKYLDSVKRLDGNVLEQLGLRKFTDLMEQYCLKWVEAREVRSEYKAKMVGKRIELRNELLNALCLFRDRLEALIVVYDDEKLRVLADTFVESLYPYSLSRTSGEDAETEAGAEADVADDGLDVA